MHADITGLLDCNLDAVVIAAPDAFHPDLAVAALEAGLHVLCEKPLALTLAGCDRIAAARDRAGKVLQVAYMKRHDPAYKRALELLPANIADVKLISVEVNDPDFEPFTAHLPMTWPKDIPADLRSEARSATAAQLRESAGADLSRRSARRRSAADTFRPWCTTSRWCTASSVISASRCRPRRITERCSTKAAACSWRSGCPAAVASR